MSEDQGPPPRSPWWRDPVLRAMAVALAAGTALLGLITYLYLWHWPG